MEDKKPKKNPGIELYLWWRIDPEDLKEQIVNYDTLGFWKSARKVSAFCLGLSAVMTTVFYLFGKVDYLGLIDMIAMALLAIFVYQGHRWAAMAAMILWSFEKGVAIYSNMSPVMQVIWWCAYMKFFYLTYKVGHDPVKPTNPSESHSSLQKPA